MAFSSREFHLPHSRTCEFRGISLICPMPISIDPPGQRSDSLLQLAVRGDVVTKHSPVRDRKDSFTVRLVEITNGRDCTMSQSFLQFLRENANG
jgi:hypothetical protein